MCINNETGNILTCDHELVLIYGYTSLNDRDMFLKNASLSDFVVVRTSYSVLTQTQTVQYSLLHIYAIWYSLLLLGYKPVQHVTVLNTVGNCNAVVSIIILYYYNITHSLHGAESFLRSYLVCS